MTQSEALDIMKTGANIFLTGEPGSGKTHLVNRYVSYLRDRNIESAITASTGIAATHLGGVTIHSWSGIGIKSRLNSHELDRIATDKKIAKKIQAAKVLVIDEISMLPPATLDMAEAVCRRARQNHKPFGGLQVILVGDFFQLPPIVRNEENRWAGNKMAGRQAGQRQIDRRQAGFLPAMSARFAYGAAAWAAASPEVCYLGDQYRQDDEDYLALLSAIRANSFSENHLRSLTTRKIDYHEAPKGLPKLFSHNVDVDRVNDERLAQLPGESRHFTMKARGAKNLVETLKRGCLSPEILALKVGASVMFTKNSPKGLFVNGTLGKVEKFDSASGYPVIATRQGKKVTAEPVDWLLEEDDEPVAQITQLPLRLAWAITVHKSQGMSLDGAVMDLSGVFEFGQGYVALSRVRRLSGLYLLGWNRRAFEVHPEIVAKDNDFRTASDNSLAVFARLSPANRQNLHHRFVNLCGGMV